MLVDSEIRSYLLAMQWDQIKGALNAMIAVSGNHPVNQQSKYHELSLAVRAFINKVEREELQY